MLVASITNITRALIDDPISYDIYDVYIYIVYNLGECGILHMTSLDDEISYIPMSGHMISVSCMATG